MINLIPPDARKAIVREYWLRVVIVWLVLAAIAMGIVAVLKLPTYILVSTQTQAFSQQFSSAKARQDEFKKSEEQIATANQTANHLMGIATSTPFSSYRTTLDQLAPAGVIVTELKFRQAAGVVEDIAVVGQANTRAQLITFKDAVTEHELFETVDLPISNLASDENLMFSLMVTPTNPETE